MYKNAPNIVLSNAFTFEPGVRATGSLAIEQANVESQEANNPAAILATSKINGNGIENSAQFINNYMEYDFPVKNIGYNQLLRNNLDKIRICGVLEPPGKLILRRYLNAISEGNITFVTDGGLGYILGQPNQLRPFLKEYYSLPKIGMKKVSDPGNPIALWYGKKAGNVYYYLVNRTDKTVNIKINFSTPTASIGISSNLAVDTNNLPIPPYSLMTFKNTVPNSIPLKVKAISIK